MSIYLFKNDIVVTVKGMQYYTLNFDEHYYEENIEIGIIRIVWVGV